MGREGRFERFTLGGETMSVEDELRRRAYEEGARRGTEMYEHAMLQQSRSDDFAKNACGCGCLVAIALFVLFVISIGGC